MPASSALQLAPRHPIRGHFTGGGNGLVIEYLTQRLFWDPRSHAKGREEHLFVRGVTRRGAENGKGVLGSLCAAGKSCAYWPHFAIENRGSGRRQRALVYQPAQAAANCAFHYPPRRTQPQVCHCGRRFARARAIDLGCQRVLAGAGQDEGIVIDGAAPAGPGLHILDD